MLISSHAVMMIQANSLYIEKMSELPVTILFDFLHEIKEYDLQKSEKTHECLKCTPKDTELNWVDVPPTRTLLTFLYDFEATVSVFFLVQLLFISLFLFFLTFFYHVFESMPDGMHKTLCQVN